MCTSSATGNVNLLSSLPSSGGFWHIHRLPLLPAENVHGVNKKYKYIRLTPCGRLFLLHLHSYHSLTSAVGTISGALLLATNTCQYLSWFSCVFLPLVHDFIFLCSHWSMFDKQVTIKFYFHKSNIDSLKKATPTAIKGYSGQKLVFFNYELQTKFCFCLVLIFTRPGTFQSAFGS